MEAMGHQQNVKRKLPNLKNAKQTQLVDIQKLNEITLDGTGIIEIANSFPKNNRLQLFSKSQPCEFNSFSIDPLEKTLDPCEQTIRGQIQIYNRRKSFTI